MGVVIPVPCSAKEDSATSAMQIQGSLQIAKEDTPYLSRTPGSGGNRKTWTMSWWMRRTFPGNGSRFISTGYDSTGAYGFYVGFNSDKFTFVANHDSIGLDLRPSWIMEDTAAWYHCVCTLDTTQGTASDRAAVYINGEKVTDFATENYPGQDTTPNWNNTSKTHTIGAWNINGSMADAMDGYITQFYCIDGQSLDASYFGYTDPLTNTWRPKKYEGTYGTQGFNLPMDGNGATIGADQSGNGNTWSLNSIDSTNVCAQSPSGIVYAGKQRHGGSTTYNASRLPANYCTLDANNMGGNVTLKSAGTEVDSSGAGNIMGTHVIPPNSGKYYWECKVLNTMSGVIGIAQLSVANESALSDNPSIRGYGADGQKYYGSTGAAYGSAMSHSGWVGVLFDSDQRKLEFTYNGVNQGVAFTAGANGIVDGAYYAPCFYMNSMDLDTVNFGANYAYSTTAWSTVPPEGYKTLCDASLSQSTEIVESNEYVDTVLYTGNGATDRGISGLNFQPDLMYFSPRNEAGWKTVFDSVRGDGKSIYTNSSWAQESLSNTGGVPLQDGFTVGYNNAYSSVFTNKNTISYVAWCWKAGGNKNTFNKDDVGYASAAAAGLTAGTDPSTDVLGSSVGTKQGFSIIKYNNPDGGTHEFPHGLTETPQVLISKKLATQSWYVHTTAIDGSVDYARLDLNNAFSGSSRTFSATEAPMINSSGDFIAYLWHSVPGFSKFGSYTGNADSNGACIYLGFRPQIIIYKATSTTSNWVIYDTVRGPYNTDNKRLRINTDDVEGDVTRANIFSDGFKLVSSSFPNTAQTYLYMAWAENPFANLYGGQSNAR